MNMNFKITMTALTLSFVAATAESQAIEIYSGVTFGGQDLNYGPAPSDPPNLQQMDPGPILGAGMYYGLPNSLEAGVDLMYTNQGYTT